MPMLKKTFQVNGKNQSETNQDNATGLKVSKATG
jgi:hypothetical protein